ncbi:MAG: hypothetical protein IPK82_40905 [Polyangiaceae bacterium]|nr:hypothetical protein [Polyangiaceae bacterium]
MPVVVLGLASPMLANCGAVGGKLGGNLGGGVVGDAMDAAQGCDEFDAGEIAKLDFSAKGGAALNGQIKAFLDASAKLKDATAKMEIGLVESCGQLGKDLGMKEEEVKAEPKGDGKAAEKVCTAVAGKVKAMVDATAKGKLTLKVEEPKCYADIDVMMKCFDECGSPIKGGQLEVACKGGEISGKCEASCKGSCTVDAGAQCTGSCKGSCSGKCDANFTGTCGGKCDGKCDGKASKGAECKGVCEGKCDAKAEGQCGGTCEGSCSANCEVKAAAKCEGSCKGGCSAEIKAPSCSGKFEPPEVSVDCQVSCAAKAAASIKCDPPELKIAFTGQATVDGVKLVGALQKTFPKIIRIQLASGKRVLEAVKAVGEAGVKLKDGAVKAGGKAVVCIAKALEATASASASIEVNVSVSAKVNTSATGGT